MQIQLGCDIMIDSKSKFCFKWDAGKNTVKRGCIVWVVNMNDLFYLELREKIREIRSYEQAAAPAEIEEWRKQTVEMAAALSRLSWLTKKEGLLAAEGLSYSLVQSLPLGEELHELICLLVDGTEPAMIEEIGLQRYFVEDGKEYQGLMHLILVKGIMGIAQNEPWIVQKQLRAMLPAQLDKIYCQREQEREEEEREKERIQGELDCRKVAELSPGTYIGEIQGDEAVPVRRLDYVLSHISDSDLVRLLREVVNEDLKAALRGLGSEARIHVFRNMSKRLAGMTAKEIISEGIIEVREVMYACQKILAVWNLLAEKGEVNDV